jgi:probable rRNA maturation factor
VKLHVDVQTASTEQVPTEEEIRSWIAATLTGRSPHEEVEVSVRLVDGDEMEKLNESFRGIAGATNVLSFPANLPEELGIPLLGDIVICAPVVSTEASQQGKSLSAHWAHMTVHGTLHLMGYDHTNDEDALIMEALETDILSALNYRCPYAAPLSSEHLHG